MPIRREEGDLNRQSRLHQLAVVSTLPTVKAMRDCFAKYLNLTIADGKASTDTIICYRNYLNRFLAWCKEQEIYPALTTQEDIKEYRKYLIDGDKSCATISLSLVVIRHFYEAAIVAKLINSNPALGVRDCS